MLFDIHKRLTLALLIVISFTHLANARTYYVRMRGSDRESGKSPRTAFKTILHAAQVLNHGDSVVIGPGTYRESVLFAERFSAAGTEMRITGDENGRLTGDRPRPVVIIPATLSAPALRFYRFRDLLISGLTFRGPGDGLALDKCNSVVVQRCTFDGLRRGLNVKTTVGLRVESTVFNRCTIGISLRGTVKTRLAHLTMANTSSTGSDR